MYASILPNLTFSWGFLPFCWCPVSFRFNNSVLSSVHFWKVAQCSLCIFSCNWATKSDIWSLFPHPENYRLQSAYENNLIIKMVFVSHNAFVLEANTDILSYSVSVSLMFSGCFTVWIHQFLPQSFLHWVLPQRHGATEGGERCKNWFLFCHNVLPFF